MEIDAKGVWIVLLLLPLGNVLGSGNILQMLSTTPGLKTFGSWCQETVQSLYSGTGIVTVFAFNDTTFQYLSSQDRAKLESLTPEEKKEYVQTYTLMSRVSVDQMVDNSVQQSINGKQLFINKRQKVYWNPGSTGGTTTYVNGAMIVREQLQASNGIIHVLERPLNLISDKNVYQYMQNPDDPTIQTTLFKEMMERLVGNYFAETLGQVGTADRVTFFLPSENALRKVPSSKLMALQGQELANYFKMHYVLNRVVYTSYVEHQESYETAQLGTRLMFMKQDDGRVLVGSGGVTAMIVRGNITTRNGVIHIIDAMFGFVYNSAREQIALDAPQFSLLIDRSTPDLQALISQPNAVNMFVPTDKAFSYIHHMVDLHHNTTLVDYIIRLHLVRDSSNEVSQIGGNYFARQIRYSRFNDWKLAIYKDRNEFWVDGGFVRGRIIKPDVKVTNGNLQYTDTVLGVPSMDIPTLISYEEYLLLSYSDMKRLGLDLYLEDPTFNASFLPPRLFSDNTRVNDNFASTTNSPSQYTSDYYTSSSQNVGSSGFCGNGDNICQFTVFVPNDTAIQNYHASSFGQRIVAEIPRYRWIFRRLIIPNQLIFLETLPVSPYPYNYTADNGEEVQLYKETENVARLLWNGTSTRFMMWDLGATNGVVHIIENVLSAPSDMDLDISNNISAEGNPASPKPVLDMGQADVREWLRNAQLAECIQAFREFDGKLLLQLKQLRTEAPEFFYQSLEKKLFMSLIEILKFTRALDELH